MNIKNDNLDIFDFIPSAIFTSCIKLLFLNSYHSTDFEVHRNWLAITSSFPISQWYYEETSEWTLDYPPFFAWFEYTMSYVAYYFDEKMLDVDNLNYKSKNTVLFQRLSVVFVDFLLLLSVNRFYNCCVIKKNHNVKMFVLLATVLNAGLLLVDHIHFQYNGFLFGILLFSITDMLQGKCLASAFWFAVLLNFKHIFLYIAPVYFVFLLRNYCFSTNHRVKGLFSLIGVDLRNFSTLNLCKLVFVVVTVFSISFGPFIYMGQIVQVLSRLFPVKRGLCHAYWAANFWAVYASLDKVLVTAGPKLGLPLVNRSNVASMTGGLVAQQDFSVLPNIPPFLTGVVTILFMLPALLKIWYRPRGANDFLPALTLCAFASFVFGYHVHEKAILMVIIPLIILALRSPNYARVYVVLSTIGHYALFPLLYKPAETPLKILIFLLFNMVTLPLLKSIHKKESSKFYLPFTTIYESLYIYGLIPLYLYTDIGHWLLGLQARLPFIPLMMTSLYCSIGVLWSWFILYKEFFLEVPEDGGFVFNNLKQKK